MCGLLGKDGLLLLAVRQSPAFTPQTQVRDSRFPQPSWGSPGWSSRGLPFDLVGDRPKERAFGWSGEGTDEIGKILDDMRVEIAGGPIGVNYLPNDQELQECYRLGEKTAERLLEMWGEKR